MILSTCPRRQTFFFLSSYLPCLLLYIIICIGYRREVCTERSSWRWNKKVPNDDNNIMCVCNNKKKTRTHNGRRVRRNRRQPVAGAQTRYMNIYYYYLRHVERWCILYDPFSNPRTVRVQFSRVHVFPPPRPHGKQGGGSTPFRGGGVRDLSSSTNMQIGEKKTKKKKKSSYRTLQDVEKPARSKIPGARG